MLPNNSKLALVALALVVVGLAAGGALYWRCAAKSASENETTLAAEHVEEASAAENPRERSSGVPVGWDYEWTPGTPVVTADSAGNGTSMQRSVFTHADGPSDIIATNLRTFASQATTRQVVLAYLQNDAKGDEEFLGKKLDVTGRLLKVERVAEKHYLLTLRAELAEDGEVRVPPQRDKTTLAFVFTIDSRKQLAGLQAGQLMTIDGVCKGRTAQGRDAVTFRDCQIVNTK